MNPAVKPPQSILETENQLLKEALASATETASQLSDANRTLSDEVDFLKERIAWFERHVFGQRSEKIIPPASEKEQFLPGMEPPKEETVQTATVNGHKRKKRKPKNDYEDGLLIPEGLPIEQEVLDLPEEEKRCPETGTPLKRIGEEVTRRLAHRPGSYYVKEIVRPKYASPLREEVGVFVREAPPSLLPRSRADESLLAEVITRKYADHLPLYRLSEIFSRDGLQIPRQVLSEWIIKAGNALRPLYDLMLKQIKESGNVYVDETPVRLQVKGKGKTQQAYMWTLAGGLGADPPYRVYSFSENRNYIHAYQLLDGFSGVMHSDKYGAYENLAKRSELSWQACWAHIRRKFEEAKTGDPEFRRKVLRLIHWIYRFERIAWERGAQERLQIRREREAPIIDQLVEMVKQKISEGGTLPKSKFSQALNYFHGLIPHLKTYHDHPHARIDNNVAERAVRPLAIGRKNWLFVGSIRGGEASAVLLSLVQTCRGLGINPREYLEDVMRRIIDHPISCLAEWLPDQWGYARKAHQDSLATRHPLHKR